VPVSDSWLVLDTSSPVTSPGSVVAEALADGVGVGVARLESFDAFEPSASFVALDDGLFDDEPPEPEPPDGLPPDDPPPLLGGAAPMGRMPGYFLELLFWKTNATHPPVGIRSEPAPVLE
jgi:hypothetical protein